MRAGSHGGVLGTGQAFWEVVRAQAWTPGGCSPAGLPCVQLSLGCRWECRGWSVESKGEKVRHSCAGVEPVLWEPLRTVAMVAGNLDALTFAIPNVPRDLKVAMICSFLMEKLRFRKVRHCWPKVTQIKIGKGRIQPCLTPLDVPRTTPFVKAHRKYVQQANIPRSLYSAQGRTWPCSLGALHAAGAQTM